jgi:hypothetical protein
MEGDYNLHAVDDVSVFTSYSKVFYCGHMQETEYITPGSFTLPGAVENV